MSGLRPELAARLRSANFTTSLRKSFGLAMPAGFSILRQLLIQKLAIHQLAGVRILVVLIFDPGVGIGDVAVEQVLAVIRVGFEIGLLDLVTDELGCSAAPDRS